MGCLLLELLIQSPSQLQITLSYSGTFEKLSVPFIAHFDAPKNYLHVVLLPSPVLLPPFFFFALGKKLSWLLSLDEGAELSSDLT